MKTIYLISSFLLFTICSCITLSPFPFYQNNTYYDSRLIGNWVPEDSTNELEYKVIKIDSTSYLINLINKSEKESFYFIGKTFKINNNEYIDMFSNKNDSLIKFLESQYFFPMHAFFKLTITDTTVAVGILNDKWINSYLIKHTALNYYTREDYLFLTDSTHLFTKIIETYDKKGKYLDKDSTKTMFQDIMFFKKINK
jgi:hypothetical protein